MSKSVSNVIIEPKTAFPLLWASHLIWMLSFIFSKLVVVWELNRVLAFLAACQPLFLIKKKHHEPLSTAVQPLYMHDKLKTRLWSMSFLNKCEPAKFVFWAHSHKFRFSRWKVKGRCERKSCIFNRAICLKTCKIQINLLYELCSELDSAILLNWWFYRTRPNSFFLAADQRSAGAQSPWVAQKFSVYSGWAPSLVF